MVSQGRILVVDDSEDIRMLLVRYLRNLGFYVEPASDGQDALEKYMSGEFDLIVSDLFMPHIDGMALLKRIRDIDKEALFIMITGYPTIETAVDAIKSGAFDYITKPFNLEDVRLKVERAFEKKSLKARLKTVEGFNWALLLSIPLWLVLGITLAILLKM